ncbi:MAG: Bax inhibitor-1/YccA family protein [Prevotellaceae bacterium]|jgi:uncharacterized YccA/Bax inhibitor family protein|nr:Bax inhibitor-1/YccA family protein [Prevotellaceae bacterium]
MAIFGNSSNPAMKESIFEKVALVSSPGGTMTVKGSVIKTFLLLAMTIFAASFTWYTVYHANSPTAVTPWLWGGLISGFVLAMIICFAPKTSPYLAPLYAVAEGFALGGISAFFETAFAEKFPGIVLTAVSITLLTALIMLFCYQTGLIKVTNRLRSVIVIATISIAAFYFVVIILNLFKVATPFYHGSSLLSIGISAVIVVIAALNLLLDFDFIEKGSQAGAPKYMEWYGAFGLLLTLVWLYLEILRLLSKIASRN